MCNNHENHVIDFSDLDEDMSIPGAGQGTMTPAQSVEHWREKGSTTEEFRYEERCKDCHGTGKFVSYSGRVVGPCFKCKGTGKLKFKTSPEQRAKNKEQAEKCKQAKIEARKAKSMQWIEEHREVFDFLVATTWSEFYRSMVTNIGQYGSLTPGQLSAVERGMAKAKAKETKQAEKVEQAPTVKAIVAAFDKARENGLKRPKLVFGEIALSQAAPTSQNPGMVYVKYQGEYAGKITTDGKFLPIRSCPEPVLALVKELGEGDLLSKAKAYGLQTGNCCCCNRELTDPVSVAKGIGPICEGRWF